MGAQRSSQEKKKDQHSGGVKTAWRDHGAMRKERGTVSMQSSRSRANIPPLGGGGGFIGRSSPPFESRVEKKERVTAVRARSSAQVRKSIPVGNLAWEGYEERKKSALRVG